jgi:hypothetical protein
MNGMNLRKGAFLSWPIYPVLFGLYIPLNYFTHNQALYGFSDTQRSLIIAPLLVGLICLTLWLATRRIHFAALIATLLTAYAVYFCITPLVEIPIIVAASVILWLKFRDKIGSNFSRITNVMMLVVLVQPLLAIASFKQVIQAELVDPLGTSPFSNISLQQPRDSDTLPTIVHIVLDAYASNATLQDIFNYDNTAFTNDLAELGFIVGHDVRTPYNQTLLVMSSIFSGNYFASGQGPLSEPNPDLLRGALGTLVTEGWAQQRLRELDYNYLFVETGYQFLRRPDSSMASYPGKLPDSSNPYEAGLLSLIGILPPPRQSEAIKDRNENTYLRHALTTDFYRTAKTPFLLYEHVLAPHPPFIIDRDGNDTSQWKEFNSISADTKGEKKLIEGYKQGYLEKLRYTNAAVLEQTRKMIRDIPGPKIILVHGDHGSGAYFDDTDPNDPGSTCLSERYNTFLAVYSNDPIIRDKFMRLETERFNLVNLYRLIFDAKFESDIGLLEDQSFYAAWHSPQQLNRLDEKQISAECSI